MLIQEFQQTGEQRIKFVYETRVHAYNLHKKSL